MSSVAVVAAAAAAAAAAATINDDEDCYELTTSSCETSVIEQTCPSCWPLASTIPNPFSPVKKIPNHGSLSQPLKPAIQAFLVCAGRAGRPVAFPTLGTGLAVAI